MLRRLQQKWKLTPAGLAVVLLCFALGGSLCGFVSRKLLALTGPESGAGKWVVYVVLLTLTWPFCVLLIGHLLGQGAFFRNYLSKMGRRLTGQKQLPTFRLAIFASGGGSNARALMEHFAQHPHIKVVLLVCNKAGAGVLNIAREKGIETLLIDRKTFAEYGYVTALRTAGVTHIVLAGFLLKVPEALIAAYPDAIVNIHPALLPKFGGKGMYGHHVHSAVVAAQEAETGITIHLVDEHYDHGAPLFQTACPVLPGDTPETVAANVLKLEHRHYAPVVERWLMDKTKGR